MTAPTSLSVVRGANKTLRFLVRNGAGAFVDLTGGKAWFTVKNRVDDVEMLVRKRTASAGGLDAQMLITTPQTGTALGEVKVFLVPTDTTNLDPNATYWCDAWVQLASGLTYQMLSNIPFVVMPAVTVKFT